VLAEALFREGLKFIAAGVDANQLVRGMKKGVEAGGQGDRRSWRPRSPGKKDIQNVATISANNDPEIGKIMADAFEKVGKDGVITVEEGKSLETEVDVVEGMQFDRGYLSPNFVTDADEMKVELDKCLVLVHEDKIESVQKLVPLLEKVMKAKKPLLIIAEDITGEALSTLVINKLRGTLQVAAVKAPGYGDRRKAMLQDIAVLTGAKADHEGPGRRARRVELADLGMAKKIEIDNDNTIIIEGAGATKDIQARIEQIRREIDAATSDYDREKLQERLAKLVGRRGADQRRRRLRGGAEGEEGPRRGRAARHPRRDRRGHRPGRRDELRPRPRRGRAEQGVEGRLRQEEGGHRRRHRALRTTSPRAIESSFKALTVPLRTIADNAGAKGSVVVAKVAEKTGSPSFGYNALTDTYEDLVKGRDHPRQGGPLGAAERVERRDHPADRRLHHHRAPRAWTAGRMGMGVSEPRRRPRGRRRWMVRAEQVMRPRPTWVAWAACRRHGRAWVAWAAWDLPESSKERPVQGKVVAVGPGKLMDNGKRAEMQIKKGDTVVYGKYSGTEVEIKGAEHLILRESELLGVLD
jgi:chaperonin GroEL